MMKKENRSWFEQIADWMVMSVYRRIDQAFVAGHIAEDYWGFQVRG